MDNYEMNLLVNARKCKTTSLRKDDDSIIKALQVVERKMKETPTLFGEIQIFTDFIENRWERLIKEFKKQNKLD